MAKCHNTINNMRFKKELIYEHLDRKRITQVRFCLDCCISPFQLRKILEGDEDMIVACASRLAWGLGVKVIDLFED